MSTEVKPTDWDAEDNRLEPTPSGGGGGLPSYTSADKGKFLGLGEGSTPDSVEPKWENAGVVVNLTFQNTSGGVAVNHYTSSKTYAEILALVTAGVPVTVRYSNLDDSGTESPLTVEYVPYSAVSQGGRLVQFCKCSPRIIEGTSVTIDYFTIYYLAQAVPDLAPEAILHETFEVTSTID